MAKEKIVVEGGTPLAGEVHISGAKNSALKLIAAALLGQGESAIHNVPLISDIVVMSKVIETLGGSVRRDGHTLHVDTAGVDTWETPYELVSKMRASISVLGPLVARFGKARVAMPGGCNLGARKIDMHMVRLYRSKHAQWVARRVRRARFSQRGRHGKYHDVRRDGEGPNRYRKRCS